MELNKINFKTNHATKHDFPCIADINFRGRTYEGKESLSTVGIE